MNNFNRHTAKPTSAGTAGDVIFYDGTEFTDDFVSGKGIYLSNGINWILMVKTDGSRPIYTAFISQSLTNDPTVTILENTLYDDIVWTRTNLGEYEGTLIGAFPANKTFTFIAQENTFGGAVTLKRLSDDTVKIETNSSDDILNMTPLEIRIYP